MIENLKAYDPKKLRAEILEKPPVKGQRVPNMQYRCLTEALVGVWNGFLRDCEELGQDYAKMYLEMQGWDVDWDYDYELELRGRIRMGRKKATDHKNTSPEEYFDFKSQSAGNGE